MSTRFLRLSQFCRLYNFDARTVKKLIKEGSLWGVFNGHNWRILDPSWDWIRLLHDRDLMLEALPVLRTREVALILDRALETIEDYREDGQLHGIKVGKEWRHSLTDVRELMANLQAKKTYRCRKISFNKALIEWSKERLKLEPPRKDYPFLFPPDYKAFPTDLVAMEKEEGSED